MQPRQIIKFQAPLWWKLPWCKVHYAKYFKCKKIVLQILCAQERFEKYVNARKVHPQGHGDRDILSIIFEWVVEFSKSVRGIFFLLVIRVRMVSYQGIKLFKMLTSTSWKNALSHHALDHWWPSFCSFARFYHLFVVSVKSLGAGGLQYIYPIFSTLRVSKSRNCRVGESFGVGK